MVERTNKPDMYSSEACSENKSDLSIPFPSSCSLSHATCFLLNALETNDHLPVFGRPACNDKKDGTRWMRDNVIAFSSIKSLLTIGFPQSLSAHFPSTFNDLKQFFTSLSAFLVKRSHFFCKEQWLHGKRRTSLIDSYTAASSLNPSEIICGDEGEDVATKVLSLHSSSSTLNITG
ncbi:uncharacterized protein LOC135610613 [Musa acuminata AAA Group]|uniref:uncharacterized protein LOC135610613 n=1 Tax=Musa acuminata AAA Group TaxID=214697 RepID=UPI0031D2DD85